MEGCAVVVMFVRVVFVDCMYVRCMCVQATLVLVQRAMVLHFVLEAVVPVVYFRCDHRVLPTPISGVCHGDQTKTKTKTMGSLK